MPLNADFVGRTYPPTEPYQVGREKIREFADAIGDPNPAYRDVAAAKELGYPDVIAPPTFPFVMELKAHAVAVGDPELGVDYSRVVHGEQRFTYTRPIIAGDELTATVTIAGIRSVAGNDILTLQTDITTTAGEQVVTCLTVIVVRGEG